MEYSNVNNNINISNNIQVINPSMWMSNSSNTTKVQFREGNNSGEK